MLFLLFYPSVGAEPVVDLVIYRFGKIFYHETKVRINICFYLYELLAQGSLHELLNFSKIISIESRKSLRTSYVLGALHVGVDVGNVVGGRVGFCVGMGVGMGVG